MVSWPLPQKIYIFIYLFIYFEMLKFSHTKKKVSQKVTSVKENE